MTIPSSNSGAPTPLTPTGPGPAKSDSVNQKEAAASKPLEKDSAAAKTDAAAAAASVKKDTSSTSTEIVPVKPTPFSTYNEPYTKTALALEDGLPIPPILRLVAEYADMDGLKILQYANDEIIKPTHDKQLIPLDGSAQVIRPANIHAFTSVQRPKLEALYALREQLYKTIAKACVKDGILEVPKTEFTAAHASVQDLIKSGQYQFCKEALDHIQQLLSALATSSTMSPVEATDHLKRIYRIFLCIQEMLPAISGVRPSAESEAAEKTIKADCYLNGLRNYRPISEHSLAQFFKENPHAEYVIHDASLSGTYTYTISINSPEGVQTIGDISLIGGISWKRDLFLIQFVRQGQEPLTFDALSPATVVQFLNQIPIMIKLPPALYPYANYYHSNMNQEQAEKLLATQADKSYLLRDGPVKGQFAFSSRNGHVYSHELLNVTKKNQVYVLDKNKIASDIVCFDYFTQGLRGGINPRLMHLPPGLRAYDWGEVSFANSYHPGITLDQAKSILANKDNGSYLIKDSAEKGKFEIVYKKYDYCNVAILQFDTQTKRVTIQEGGKSLVFDDLNQALDHLDVSTGIERDPLSFQD